VLAIARDKREWYRQAVCAFYSNANVKPALPKDITPYQDEAVQQVTVSEFAADLRRIRGQNGSR